MLMGYINAVFFAGKYDFIFTLNSSLPPCIVGGKSNNVIAMWGQPAVPTMSLGAETKTQYVVATCTLQQHSVQLDREAESIGYIWIGKLGLTAKPAGHLISDRCNQRHKVSGHPSYIENYSCAGRC